jgi:hypothetical protein
MLGGLLEYNSMEFGFCLPVSHRLRALWLGVGHHVAVAGQGAMTASAASEKFLRP